MDHILLRARNTGINLKMRGNIGFFYILVDTPHHKWRKLLEKETITKIKQTSEYFMKCAAQKKVPLNIRNFVLHAKISSELQIDKNMDSEEKEIMAQIGYQDVRNMWGAVSSKNHFDDVVICFVLACDGTSFAHQSRNYMDTEYAVIMAKDRFETYVHEILHLYGAVDFYYTDFIKDKVRNFLGSSIMLSTQEPYIDTLTAYLIGWDDEPTEMAKKFLRATSHITAEEWAKALDEEVSSRNSRPKGIKRFL